MPTPSKKKPLKAVKSAYPSSPQASRKTPTTKTKSLKNRPAALAQGGSTSDEWYKAAKKAKAGKPTSARSTSMRGDD